jgi:hypothetical protein
LPVAYAAAFGDLRDRLAAREAAKNLAALDRHLRAALIEKVRAGKFMGDHI